MSSFFRLMPVLTDDTMTIDLKSHEDFSFTMGLRFDKNFKPPVKFKVSNKSGIKTWPTLFLPEPVFHLKFLEHLRQAGVSNIDDYPLSFSGIKNNKKQETHYRAVNIIGNVSCADLKRSKFEEFDGMYFFDNLIIDEKKAKGKMFFRVAEGAEYIVLSKTLVERLDLSIFPDVMLAPLQSLN